MTSDNIDDIAIKYLNRVVSTLNEELGCWLKKYNKAKNKQAKNEPHRKVKSLNKQIRNIKKAIDERIKSKLQISNKTSVEELNFPLEVTELFEEEYDEWADYESDCHMCGEHPKDCECCLGELYGRDCDCEDCSYNP